MNCRQAVETMCNNCKNHEMCMGTGCRPKNDLLFCADNFETVKKLYDVLVKNNEKLEQALDRACSILSKEDIYPCDYGEDETRLEQCYKCNDEFVNVKNCWKEWCSIDEDE